MRVVPTQSFYPTRVVDADKTRRIYGQRVDQVLPWLWRSDPLADDVVALLREQPIESAALYHVLQYGRTDEQELPPAVDRFFNNIETIPDWVDWKRIERAGALFFRTGLAGGIVLGAKSLCYGYCSPGGNKPLIMTGRLRGDSINMRLAETSRYVVETCKRDGLRRFGQGFVITIRVRLMHAVVRGLLRETDSWSTDRWGVPINQHDMLGTALLFSQSFVEGVRQFGFSVDTREAEDYLHLWRYAAHLMGLDESLFPTSESDALILADIILRTQGTPDADARTLIDSLVRARNPKRNGATAGTRRGAAQIAAGYGFCRALLGDELSDALELPKDGWRFAIPILSRLIGAIEPLRRRLPRLDRRLAEAGYRHWERSIDIGRQGKPTIFAAPTHLTSDNR